MPQPSLRRLLLFLAVTFAITWTCWWSLAWLVGHRITAYGDPSFMATYVLGGLGPTIAAYVAVIATSREAPLREYQERLLRWRVGAFWYVAALGLPLLLAAGARWLGAAIAPGSHGEHASVAWLRVLAVFPMMIVGGGLEELGWRGVAQPELERRTARLPATLAVGAIWAIWHLPLFFIAGTPQYGQDFLVFSIEVLGSAFLLAWLYAGTGSILLCVLFHAAQNTTAALGYGLPASLSAGRLGAALFRLFVGVTLVATIGRRPTDPGDERPG
jgi:membrane protease YdiL (CAAX protease family)